MEWAMGDIIIYEGNVQELLCTRAVYICAGHVYLVEVSLGYC